MYINIESDVVIINRLLISRRAVAQKIIIDWLKQMCYKKHINDPYSPPHWRTILDNLLLRL
jgi:hypothetical protein